jgi:hypothetical protein
MQKVVSIPTCTLHHHQVESVEFWHWMLLVATAKAESLKHTQTQRFLQLFQSR